MIKNFRNIFFVIYFCCYCCCDGFRVCERNDPSCQEPTTTGQTGISKKRENLDSDFSYPDNFKWDDMSSDDLWGWLRSQLRKDLTTFCRQNKKKQNKNDANEPSVSVVTMSSSNCDKIRTTFKGSVDKNGLPKSIGVLHALSDREIQSNPKPNR